jgi:hypothetical protein
MGLLKGWRKGKIEDEEVVVLLGRLLCCEQNMCRVRRV